MAWFRKGEDDQAEGTEGTECADAGGTDDPTGRIAADVIAEADGGTGPVPAASKPDVEPVTTAAPTELEQALADRRALIQLCLYAMDRARSGGVAERLEQGLAAVGVTALRPDGQRFDPAVHEAGGAVPTDDVTLEGTVAETEVVGFVDRDRLLRAPVVTVYTRR
ncbi:GrpE protein [Amycolatopsis arida]|uniref:GrpE protein n=1 Tax=Amycolatopsis arida TaxID=587909 RepID=A0A1I5TAI7_9PSEU|nr:nucleotide exchange factor GrpE [Amycolatopsis arida]TDX96160.1 GrpE protein [Amycolatopsis arida]SFP80040.1 GrpE protein [Amycolatopsis arida]